MPVSKVKTKLAQSLINYSIFAASCVSSDVRPIDCANYLLGIFSDAAQKNISFRRRNSEIRLHLSLFFCVIYPSESREVVDVYMYPSSKVCQVTRVTPSCLNADNTWVL